jgi:hypothetical protein
MPKKPPAHAAETVTTYHYNASSVAATGYLILPVQEVMPVQASVAVPMGGGHGRTTVENFSHHGIFSFRYAHSEAIGRSSVKKKEWSTLAQTVIEGLNIHQMVTVDRIVSRIAIHHSMDGKDSGITPLGSTIQGLRVGGYLIEPDLAVDWFAEHDTYESFEKHHRDPKVRGQFAKMSFVKGKGEEMPHSKGIVGCTMVRDWGKLPGGIVPHGRGLWIPEFGMLYIAELYMDQGSRRVRMIRTELGCGSCGCYGGGSSSGGGSPWP